MKSANVFPIWRLVENVIKQELAKQGLCLIKGDVKSSNRGKLTIECLYTEFKPAFKS